VRYRLERGESRCGAVVVQLR